MKTALICTLAFTLCLTASAHERITIGPNGGRLLMIDSTTTPNVEFTLNDNKAHIELLDAKRKSIPLTDQSLTVIAGSRSNPTRLTAEKIDNKFVAGPLPDGDDYFIVFRLKESKKASALTFRLHYYTISCGECDRIEWLCLCGNKGSGKEIEVPNSIDGLWAELNQHHLELKEGYKDKAYEALDEVTDAFPILAAALPEKSNDLTAAQQKVVADRSAAVVKALGEIKEANSARKLENAKASVDTVATAIAALKKNYPPATANAKLKEE